MVANALNLLFVCSKNRKRSPTAEAVFTGREGIHAIGAGINPDSPTPLTGDLIEWADVILVMENAHRRRVVTRFKSVLKAKKLITLGIPDRFEFMDRELVALLERRVERSLGLRLETSPGNESVS